VVVVVVDAAFLLLLLLEDVVLGLVCVCVGCLTAVPFLPLPLLVVTFSTADATTVVAGDGGVGSGGRLEMSNVALMADDSSSRGFIVDVCSR